MRILIISYAFPPYNDIGHVRVGKTAKYLARFGHEIRVLTARNQSHQTSLPVEIPAEWVIATDWWNVNKPAEWVFGGRAVVAERGLVAKGRLRPAIEAIRALYRRVYKQCVGFPDDQIGWFPFAVRAASRLMAEWKPDLIYASAMPYTSLLVAWRVSQRCHIPWVAELRDLWVDFHRYRFGALRKRIERRVERMVLSSAVGLVTVSPPLASVLERKYRKPTLVMLNGYDPDDSGEPVETLCSSQLRIVYTGMIYEGRQDPAPLFEALRNLKWQRHQVSVEFYGRYLEVARERAQAYGVADLVHLMGQVTHQDALRIQREADALLLLLWQDTGEKGIYTGKLFEYVGAGRPILAIGPSDNVAGDLIRERGAGTVCQDAKEVGRQLSAWMARKCRGEPVAAVPRQARTGLTREDQVRRLETFLMELAPARTR